MLAVFDTLVDSKVVRSPDNPAITTPGAPGGTVDIQIRRSRGFKGMAAAKDGSELYALLEGAVYIPPPRPMKARVAMTTTCLFPAAACPTRPMTMN